MLSYCQNRIRYNLSRKYPKSKSILGGGKKYKINYKREFELIFDEILDENDIRTILLSNNLEETKRKDNSCIAIELNIKEKEAHIFGVSSSSLYNCFADPEFILKKAGSFYLKMGIKMLKKYKEKLGINKIILQDNAIISPLYGKSYNLSQFKLLTEGISWYEKYGFKINKEKRVQHKQNKEIIKKLKVNDIKLENIISNV